MAAYDAGENVRESREAVPVERHHQVRERRAVAAAGAGRGPERPQLLFQGLRVEGPHTSSPSRTNGADAPDGAGGAGPEPDVAVTSDTSGGRPARPARRPRAGPNSRRDTGRAAALPRRPRRPRSRRRASCQVHFVLAREERRVAEVAVEEEALVGVGRVGPERGQVVEVHPHGLDLERLRRSLRSERQGDPSSGWIRSRRTFASIGSQSSARKSDVGGRRNEIATSVARLARRFPSGDRRGRRPTASCPPRAGRRGRSRPASWDPPPAPPGIQAAGSPATDPAAYCPRTVRRATSSGRSGSMARSTLAFSSRTKSARSARAAPSP